MNITPFHAKYFAYELTKRSPSNNIQKFAATLLDAQVDLNPHQVEAALFAFRSPLSTGAILADEVGLGKTIEAGLVISQKWAERKRKILRLVENDNFGDLKARLQPVCKRILRRQVVEYIKGTSKNFNILCERCVFFALNFYKR